MDRRYFFKTVDQAINLSLRKKEFIFTMDRVIKRFSEDFIDWLFYDLENRRSLREIRSPAYQLLWFSVLTVENSSVLMAEHIANLKKPEFFSYIVENNHDMLIINEEAKEDATLLHSIEEIKSLFYGVPSNNIRFSKYVDKILEASQQNNLKQTLFILNEIGTFFQDLGLILDLIFDDLCGREIEELNEDHYQELWFSLINHPAVTQQELNHRIEERDIEPDNIRFLFEKIASKANPETDVYKKAVHFF